MPGELACEPLGLPLLGREGVTIPTSCRNKGLQIRAMVSSFPCESSCPRDKCFTVQSQLPASRVPIFDLPVIVLGLLIGQFVQGLAFLETVLKSQGGLSMDFVGCASE